MVVKTEEYYAQTVRTVLKELNALCKKNYRAGGGVFRELIQNADDAGAKYVKFVLDENNYPTEPLQDPCLAKYQGPALLAYNSGRFSKDDFRSLSQLGDSFKHDDGSTTGRFGLGFNAVYNYTDSPTIVSGDGFLILDPHKQWSGSGGLYNFVTGKDDDAIQNHMKAFQTIMRKPNEPFDGTIIRIPLRNNSGDFQSKISSLEPTIEDMRELLESFAQRFGTKGLLFTKHVERIIIESTSGLSIEMSILNAADVREHKSRINRAVKKYLQKPDSTFDHSFEVRLETRIGQESEKTTFHIYHHINRDTLDTQTRAWAQEEAMIPWVAIAAPIYQLEELTSSTLFTVLPLEISINQPVHIHAIFNLSDDRKKLVETGDDSDKSPGKWNEWLVHHSIPVAWARLLESVAHSHPSVNIFDLWPRETGEKTFPNTLAAVAEIVWSKILRVWPTKDSYVSETKCLMDADSTTKELRDAISNAIGPVVFAPGRLFPSLQTYFINYGACQIIEKMIIPEWSQAGAVDWSIECKSQLSSFVLSNFSALNAKSKAALQKVPLVPVSNIVGTESSKFTFAAELIDPTNCLDLTKLFFDQEEVLPSAALFKKFSVPLRKCGVRTRLDPDLLCSRIRHYAHCSQPMHLLESHVRQLFSLSCISVDSIDKEAISELRNLKWIPVKTAETVILESPSRCRGLDDELLVDSQLPIYSGPLSKEWRDLLGWNEVLPSHIILGQLRQGIEQQDQPRKKRIVNAILRYVADKELSECYQDLRDIRFVLARLPDGTVEFVKTEHVFCPPKSRESSCENLWPYLAHIDWSFWEEHEPILRHFEILDGPKANDLLALLDTLHSKTAEIDGPLSKSDLAVAVEAVTLASREPRELLQGIRIPNAKGYLSPIENICFLDRADLDPAEIPDITHPKLSFSTVEALGIESLNEWVISGILKVEEDKDLFDQHEDTATRIADTLHRYSIDSTFREYLANADDAKSTKLSWLLDDRAHPSNSLISKELESCQGPALLVYSNGVFNDDNFEGFRKVGEGSKQKDSSTIGQFGRGSQTMYHWTDVPMLISGGFFVILDPLQTSLHVNRQTGKRKPGMRIPLSRVKLLPDQLAPFDGLWGYENNMDYFPGTIFRFPLRQGNSRLSPDSQSLTTHVVSKMLGDYFHEARKSLLFLKHIHSIDFNIHGSQVGSWSVTRPEAQLDACITRVTCSYTMQMESSQEFSGKDDWWVATEDLETPTNPSISDSRMVPKDGECSVAVLVPSDADPSDRPKAGFYRAVPLQMTSELPVHVHATFHLTGDRQAVILDVERQSESSIYNRKLLQDGIPRLYLGLMAHLAMNLRPQHDVFKFWPKKPDANKLNLVNCSDLIASAFWDKIAGDYRNFYPKASLATMLGKRKLPDQPLKFEDAVFDFLPNKKSCLLAPLLLALGVNLVQNIPKHIEESLKTLKVQKISGKFLRKLFKSSSQAWKCLEAQQKQSNFLTTFLELAIPTSSGKFDDLDKCHILPTLDGTFAEIALLRNEAKKKAYYLASEAEAELFSFASSILVPPSFEKMFRPLVDTGKFNITGIEPRKIGDLLHLRQTPLGVDKKTDLWLDKFWEFWNNHPKKASSAIDDDLNGLGFVFKSTRNGIEEYKQFSDLETLPAIVDPDNPRHRQLCKNIPGLFLFDNGLMHGQLRINESSLSTSASFVRFMKSLRILSTACNHSNIGQFLTEHLSEDDFKVLRELLYVMLIHYANTPGFDDLLDDLRTIPFWPRWEKETAGFLPSCDALLAKEPRFLVPWMSFSSRFVNPDSPRPSSEIQECLRIMAVVKVSTSDLLQNYILPLSRMEETDWSTYKNFIDSISSICDRDEIHDIFRHARTAPDEKGDWYKPSDLYDHTERIFTAAFRGNPGHFLHSDVQHLRHFWLRLGLRRRKEGLVKGDHYRKCIESIAQRLHSNKGDDRHLSQDMVVVLAPLTATSDATYQFLPRHWSEISSARILPSRNSISIGVEPVYRKDCMQQLTQQTPLLSLSEVISYKYASVCWSQTTFVKELHEPVEDVLSKVNSTLRGKPSLNLVWSHLKHLSELGCSMRRDHTREFLKDLHATYAYLQTHLNYESPCPPSHTEMLWLNITPGPGELATLETVNGSWVGIEDLVLSSSCDAGSIQAVRPSLVPYEKLLRALGCKFVIHPVVQLPQTELGYDIGEGLKNLRKAGTGLDITFQSEGKQIQAHRLVLAAISDKWNRQSYGSWPIEGTITYSEEDPDPFISFHTLSIMIDYAYGEKIDWPSMGVTEAEKYDEEAKEEKLNILLDVCKGACQWLIPNLGALAERQILTFGKEFITIENVSRVKKRADKANAQTLTKLCENFEEQNRETMERAKEQVQE